MRVEAGKEKALWLPQVCGGQLCSATGKIFLPSFLSIMDTEL